MNSLRIVEIYIVLNSEPQLRQTDIIFDFDEVISKVIQKMTFDAIRKEL